LQNGFVFCRVDSWLTGRRLVSVPFSDHCEPLVDDAADMSAILSALEQQLRQEKQSHIEIRPKQTFEETTSLFHSTCAYCFHELDLKPDLDTLFRNCHKSSTQRKIQRAQREGLTYEDGRSESLLNTFYRLFLLTRRRHQAPPPSKKWFRSLIDCFGEALKIRVALKNGQPVAAILTLRYKDALVYKYGSSDAQSNNLGGMHLLFWHSIREAKLEGLRVFDLGRSDSDNTGLITFKDRWNCPRSTLVYQRFTNSLHSTNNYTAGGVNWQTRIARRLVSDLPDSIFSSIGNLLYRHIG
jgi:lipid II:glycine glycyltransferase (peptidoglycan interpeptide bridge formation enzyme)